MLFTDSDLDRKNGNSDGNGNGDSYGDINSLRRRVSSVQLTDIHRR